MGTRRIIYKAIGKNGQAGVFSLQNLDSSGQNRAKNGWQNIFEEKLGRESLKRLLWAEKSHSYAAKKSSDGSGAPGSGKWKKSAQENQKKPRNGRQNIFEEKFGRDSLKRVWVSKTATITQRTLVQTDWRL